MPEVMSIEVDEDFDPRPQQSPFGLRDPEGNLNIGMIAGIVIAIILVIALIVVIFKPFAKEAPVVVPNWKPKDPTTQVAFLETYSVDHQIVRSLQEALEAWAEFYTTGKLDGLASSFDLAGRQYAVLVSEQPSVEADPEPGDPAIIKLGPVGKVSQTDNIYVVRVEITWTKPGEEGKEYNWDVTLENRSGRYLLSAVKETDPRDHQPLTFCRAVDMIAQLDDTNTIAEQYVKFPVDQQVQVLSNVMSIRLETWQYLQKVTKGTDDGQSVDGIVSQYEEVVAAAGNAQSPQDLQDVLNRRDISDSRAFIEERALGQCNKDISNR